MLLQYFEFQLPQLQNQRKSGYKTQTISAASLDYTPRQSGPLSTISSPEVFESDALCTLKT